MLQIKNASKDEFDDVLNFYYDIIDANDSKLKWAKNTYPTDLYLYKAIENQEMLIGIYEKQIVCAVIINHSCDDSYDKINWNLSVEKNKVIFVHFLCVAPDFRKKGFARKILSCAVEYAKQNKQKAMRLSVAFENLPAKKLYENLGFCYVDSVCEFYERTGKMIFDMYEYLF